MQKCKSLVLILQPTVHFAGEKHIVSYEKGEGNKYGREEVLYCLLAPQATCVLQLCAYDMM